CSSLRGLRPCFLLSLLLSPRPPSSALFPYTTLFRSHRRGAAPGRSGARHRLIAVDAKRPALSEGWGASLYSVERAHTRRGPVFRSEEHMSELQSRFDLVCRLLLEKKNKKHLPTSMRA